MYSGHSNCVIVSLFQILLLGFFCFFSLLRGFLPDEALLESLRSSLSLYDGREEMSMPRQVGITKGAISDVAARATSKSATQYNFVTGGENLDRRGCKVEVRGRAAPRAWDPAFVRTSNAASGSPARGRDQYAFVAVERVQKASSLSLES